MPARASALRTPSLVLVCARTLDPLSELASGGRLSSTNDRKWSSGAAAVTAPPAPAPRGVPSTGTAPGAHRGAGLGQRFGETERSVILGMDAPQGVGASTAERLSLSVAADGSADV